MTTWSPRLDIVLRSGPLGPVRCSAGYPPRERSLEPTTVPAPHGELGRIGHNVRVPRVRKAPPGVDVRLALLDAAGELLVTEGADGMTTRRLAAMAGTTTQAIYTEFGGKEGIARAMYREGFVRLEARMRAVAETADPLFDLLQQGRVYRLAALDSPHFYDVMFGRPIPQFDPDADDLELS